MRSVLLSLLVRLVLVGAATVGAGLLLAHADRTTTGRSGCLTPVSADAATASTPPDRKEGNAVDCAVARRLTRHHPGLLVGLARPFVLPGATIGALIIVGVIGTGIWGERGTLFPLVILVVAWAGAELIAGVAALVVDRRRPPYALHGLGAGGAAFPAHHVLVGSAVLLALAAVLVGGGWWRSHLALTWISAAALVALLAAGQLLVGGHWLTDVAVGLAAGVTWTAALLPPIAKVVRGRGRREPFPTLRAATDAVRRFADSD